MEFFTISNGISVHVLDTDRGRVTSSGDSSRKCLILLHGYLETFNIFNEFIDMLKESYRIITLDLPGHGLTDSAPAGSDGVTINSVEFDVPVIKGVMDKCGVASAIFIGHSMGGYIALECMKVAPEICEKVILLNSHPFPETTEGLELIKREIEVIRAGKLQIIAAISIQKMYFESNLRQCDEKIRETIELCETHDPEGIIGAIRGIRIRPDLTDVMRNPSSPILLVYGENDSYLPSDKVDYLKSECQEVSFCMIPSSGHNCFIEQTELTLKAIQDFISL